MTDEQQGNDAENTPRDLDFAQARLAHSIIGVLLEHTSATGDLVALMAQALDEDAKNALTNTPVWNAYLESRRALKNSETDMERFTEAMKQLAPDE